MDYYAPNAVLIAVDGYKEKDFYGRIYTKCHAGSVEFRSSVELLYKLDVMFDAWQFPVNTVMYRDFDSKLGRKRQPSAAEIEKRKAETKLREAVGVKPVTSELSNEKGKVATIVLECQQRLHADWSGRFWVDNEVDARQFASTLELLLYLNENISERVRKKTSLWD